MINNIDVTLRDGGYQNGFSFPSNYAVKHAQTLTESGVEWIEIGYRNGSFKPIPNIGLTGISPDKYIDAIHRAAPNVKIVVIAHPHNITTDDITKMKAHGVSMLHLCIKAANPQPALALCKFAKKAGIQVSMNVVRVSQISSSRLIELANLSQAAGADIIYLADSNGSLLPEQVSNLVHIIKCSTKLKIGFHAHDNLGLAMANSIEAIKSGATFIDCSLTGMGKGSGNLALETWLTFLNAYKNDVTYDVETVFNQVESLQSYDFFSASKRSVLDMVMGLTNLSADYRSSVENILKQKSSSSFRHIRELTAESQA
ncbi:3-hydroxy-3-methylglutaryl-CoA lyase [Lonsdalea quercina]|uniref:3-hydroxy-3-methylglutaryl-CoA lyase n=1 Tax=Lonsdalea quercina TaxID=71657 RepID=UPI003F45D897